MIKDLGAVQAVFPMPVLVLAACDANGTIQSMNAGSALAKAALGR